VAALSLLYDYEIAHLATFDPSAGVERGRVPHASIGGACTFDGIVLSEIIAAYLA